MTLANMREHGVRSLTVACAWYCLEVAQLLKQSLCTRDAIR